MCKTQRRRSNAVTLIASLFFLVLCLGAPTLFICACGAVFYPQEEFIESYTSTDGTYTVDFYLSEGGIPKTSTVTGYLINNQTNEKSLLYQKYKESAIEANWINKYEVRINGVILDVRHDRYE